MFFVLCLQRFGESTETSDSHRLSFFSAPFPRRQRKFRPDEGQPRVVQSTHLAPHNRAWWSLVDGGNVKIY